VAVDAGYGRGILLRYLAAWASRDIRVDGAFTPRVLSFHPSVTAEGVTVGNPGWVSAGTAAQIGKMLVVVNWPWFGRSAGIARLELEGASLHLLRDANGHANWQWNDPDLRAGEGLVPIKMISIQNAQLELDDALRHLQFKGTASVQNTRGANGSQPVRLDAAGVLNGKQAVLEIVGDPLDTAVPGTPYGFRFAEQSSGTRLTGHGFLLKAFDFHALDASFDAAGADLKDLYYLTGVTLINTGAYHLIGTVQRRGRQSLFTDLQLASGQSDLNGRVSIDSSPHRRMIEAELNSRFLRSSDLGLGAADRLPESAREHPLLLSDAVLSPKGLRRGDVQVSYRAERVEVGRLSLRKLAATVSVDQGVMVVAPLSAEVLGGKLTARLRLDAATEVPAADLDLKITDLQLAQIERKTAGPPPLDGSLRLRIKVAGKGRSLHEIAATSNGTVTVVLPHGAIRASMAELTGIDLRGLGLLANKNKSEVPVRCGVASFEAHDGTLAVQTVVVDTEPVLITGEGIVHLDTESLDLKLRGHPKSWRLLRIRSPVLVRGTLAKPAFRIQAINSIAQSAEAVALGVVLTPLASVLAFVDAGLAKDADCAALLAAAKTGGLVATH
jgi:uncharacterized protein involved in outer membrane biogenesis